MTTLVKAISLTLSGAGRVGFYIDYSERSTSGDHAFYVCRTHGTAGAVSVDYQSYGDAHVNVSGTVHWADGEADIKSFKVNVPTKPNGDHRIYVRLSNPTGGAVLHFGVEHTVAYGVIDDGTIATDLDAVFYDVGAVLGGDGTRESPYNSIYAAIANLGSKRYLYGRGVTVPDGTDTASPGGGGVSNCILAPATRVCEDARLYIRNWPGYTWTIDGAGHTNTGGFYTSAGSCYHTYRSIAFRNLDNSGQRNVSGWSIFYHYGSASGINVELCTSDNINGAVGNNNGAYMLWGVDGGKVWRCASNNIQTAGSNKNQNTSGVYSYSGKNISVQRCEMANSYSAAYQKRVENNFDVSIAFRFNRCSTPIGIEYGAAASSGKSHSYTIAQGNLFTGCTEGGIRHIPGGATGVLDGEKHWWCNNIFDACGSGEIAAIYFKMAYKAGIFNNIMLNCRKVWADYVDASSIGPDVEFADYNVEYGTTLTSQRYEWKGINYTTAAALFVGSGFAGNDINTDPLFTDAVNRDYTLDVGSPALGGGVSGTDAGIYLTGIEVIGTGTTIPFTKPVVSAPTGRGAALEVDCSAAGTLYVISGPASANPSTPSTDHIVAGKNQDGSAAAYIAYRAVAGVGAEEFLMTGLPVNEEMVAYAVLDLGGGSYTDVSGDVFATLPIGIVSDVILEPNLPNQAAADSATVSVRVWEAASIFGAPTYVLNDQVIRSGSLMAYIMTATGGDIGDHISYQAKWFVGADDRFIEVENDVIADMSSYR